VTPQCPQGQGWEQVEGVLTTVSIAPVMGSQNLSAVWGTNSAGNIYVRRKEEGAAAAEAAGLHYGDQRTGVGAVARLSHVSCLSSLLCAVLSFVCVPVCRCVRV
jgi:hypothetical protein